jgi:hypothetical protein
LWWCPHFKPFAVTAGAASATITSTRGRNTKNPLDNIDAIAAFLSTRRVWNQEFSLQVEDEREADEVEV